jgi:hypothetical protein
VCGASLIAAAPSGVRLTEPSATSNTSAGEDVAEELELDGDVEIVDDATPSWGLRALFEQTWMSAFHGILADIRGSDGISATLAARDPTRAEGACVMGLAALARLEAEPELPTAFQRALRLAATNKADLLRTIAAESAALRQATEDVRALQLPEGAFAGFFHRAIQVADPCTAAGAGAAGGMLLGDLLLPGVGRAIGGAIGAVVGQDQADKRNQPVLARYDGAAEQMLQAVDQLFDSAWDIIVEQAAREGLDLVRSVHFARAKEAWDGLRGQLDQELDATSATRVRARIESFIRQWGPHQDALHTLIRASIRPYDTPGASVRSHVQVQLALYPGDVIAHQDAAEVELELGAPERALAIVDAAMPKHAGHVGLLFMRIEALAAGADDREAGAAELAARRAGMDRTATLHRARGLVRRGKFETAAAAIESWMREDGKRFAIARRVHADTLLSRLYERGDLPSPSHSEKLRGIVETYLDADGQKRFLGLPPSPRDMNARTEFLDLASWEQTLFFVDWSMWGNAKTGFSLTTARIVWKCLWGDPIRIPLASVSPGTVVHEESRVTVGGYTVEMEDPTLASTVAAAINELAAVGPVTGDECGGSGAKLGTNRKPCGACGGVGQIFTSRGFVMFTETCPECAGGGGADSDG